MPPKFMFSWAVLVIIIGSFLNYLTPGNNVTEVHVLLVSAVFIIGLILNYLTPGNNVTEVHVLVGCAGHCNWFLF